MGIDPGGSIRLIDFEARTIVWEEQLGYGARPLPMFSPDGHFVSLARQEGRDRDAISRKLKIAYVASLPEPLLRFITRT
jgi:hypothetical protein